MSATTREGGQTLDVKEAVTEGCQRRYRVDATPPTLSYDTVCDLNSGWLEWPDSGQINAAENQTATVVDCTISGALARSAGSVKLPAPGSAA